MKKTIAFLLALCLCTSLCSCANDQSSQKSDQTVQTVTLSTDNWDKYLHIETETRNYNSEKFDLLGYKLVQGTADCVINISKSVPCNFSNTVIKIEVYSLTTFWNEETKTVDIHVSADGNATKSVSFASKDSLPGQLDEPDFRYRIISVSGTVQVAS